MDISPAGLPSGLVASHISLNSDGCLPHAQVLLPQQPPSDCLLDPDAGSPQLICPQFFQIGHLTGTKKDLCLTKLVFVLVLFLEEIIDSKVEIMTI